MAEIKHIVVVGGGSAGWLTAALLAAEHQSARPDGLRVTLLESPDIPTIGVGEGTWPTMRDTLRKIGVSEADFLRECDASFKQGSRFNGWVTGREDDYYFHPFVLPQGYGETNLVAGWQQGHADTPFADLVSFQPHLCVQGRAPKQAATPEYAAVANYAYHLDAGKFGQFLRRHCVEKLGVVHVVDNVVGIMPRMTADGKDFDRSDADGDGGTDIGALKTERNGLVAGDLFVDCTGTRCLLLGQFYGVDFIEQKHILFNDTALAVQVPYPDENSPIASQTTSTAQGGGWIWDIGLPTRRGIGHVYSSAHVSDEAAESALLAYIRQTGGPSSPSSPSSPSAPRKLSFTPGHRAKFWHRNCVAIGQSAGFIEPLEASALAMVELSAAMLSDEMPATRAAMDIVARRFNEAFRYRWERVIDFLKLHYVLSRRADVAGCTYWHDNRQPETIPPRLQELLELWRHQPPSRYDLHRIEEVFPSASYQYVLYGMGFRPEARTTRRRADDLEAADSHFREAAMLTRKMLAALPSNRELLDHVRRHGLQRI